MSSFFPCKDPEAKFTKSVNPNDFYLLTSNDYNLKNYITAVFIFPVSKIDKKLLKHSVLVSNITYISNNIRVRFYSTS